MFKYKRCKLVNDGEQCFEQSIIAHGNSASSMLYSLDIPCCLGEIRYGKESPLFYLPKKIVLKKTVTKLRPFSCVLQLQLI